MAKNRSRDLQVSTDSESSSSGLGALARLGWMLFGPLAIFMTLLGISTRPSWDLGVRDVLLALFLGGSLWIRYVDITRFQGSTSDGAPATLQDFRRYASGLIVLTGGAWTLTHLVSL